MLVGAAFALYPVVLPARDHQYDLTIYNTAAGSHGLSVGLVWWTFAAVLAVSYFAFVYRKFRARCKREKALLAIAEVRGQIAEVSSEVRSQRSDCRGEKLQAHAAV